MFPLAKHLAAVGSERGVGCGLGGWFGERAGSAGRWGKSGHNFGVPEPPCAESCGWLGVREAPGPGSCDRIGAPEAPTLGICNRLGVPEAPGPGILRQDRGAGGSGTGIWRRDRVLGGSVTRIWCHHFYVGGADETNALGRWDAVDCPECPLEFYVRAGR